ncbi:protein ORF42 [Cyprinid herpesvirus 1]|uniref:Protein ORF42 n=1 Tax=Cyprinid herpesvirus 1 TaxID=317858 RepID=K7PBV9_9VIRU|nr:protein ORF42 [Cyprinid herpesvirus 1]AFJ20343.1 protein ORF42 [Cyprinid herpesvirus 1]
MAVPACATLNYYSQRAYYGPSLKVHLKTNTESRRLLHRETGTWAYKPPKAPIFNEPEWKPKRLKRRLTVCKHPDLGTVTFYNGRPIRVQINKARRAWVSKYTSNQPSQFLNRRGRFCIAESPGLLCVSPRAGNRSVRVSARDPQRQESGAEWLPENDWACVRTFGEDARKACMSLTFLLYLIDSRQAHFEHGAEESAGYIARQCASFYLDTSADRFELAKLKVYETVAQYAIDLDGMARDPGWSTPLIFFERQPEPLRSEGFRQVVRCSPDIDLGCTMARRGIPIAFNDPPNYPVHALQVEEPFDVMQHDPDAYRDARVSTYSTGRVAAYCEKSGVILARGVPRASRLVYFLILNQTPPPPPPEQDQQLEEEPVDPASTVESEEPGEPSTEEEEAAASVDSGEPGEPATIEPVETASEEPEVEPASVELGREYAEVEVPSDPQETWLRFFAGLVECIAAERPVVVDASRLSGEVAAALFSACCAAGLARGWRRLKHGPVVMVRNESLIECEIPSKDSIRDFAPGGVMENRWGVFASQHAATDYTLRRQVGLVETLFRPEPRDNSFEFPGWDGVEGDVVGESLQDFLSTQRDADLLEVLETRGIGDCYERQRVLARECLSVKGLRTFNWSVDLECSYEAERQFIRRMRGGFFLPRPNVPSLLHTKAIQFSEPQRRTVTIAEPETVRIGLRSLTVSRASVSGLMPLMGPRSNDELSRIKWIETNGWLGGLGASEWTPELKIPLFYYEPERVAKRRSVEKNLNDQQRALLYGEDSRRHFSGEWIGLVCSMLELDQEIMMIWCRACCSKFHSFAPKRRGIDSALPQGTPVQYARRLDRAALRPFKADRDVSEAVASCCGSAASSPKWAVLPVACRTVPTRRAAGSSQKQYAHLVNVLANEHGYTVGLPEYAFEVVEAYEYLLVGAFVLAEIKKTTLDVLLLDMGQLASAADELLNTPWYTVEAPQCFLVRHHTATYDSKLESLVALFRRSCAWVQSDMGSALVHTSDTALVRPQPLSALNEDSTPLRIIILVLLTLFEYSKLDEDVWMALVLNSSSAVTPDYLQRLEDSLTTEVARLTRRLWMDLAVTITDLDISDALCDVLWKIFSMYIGPVSSYKRIGGCIALNQTLYDAAVPDEPDPFRSLPRLSCANVAFSIQNPWNGLQHRFAVCSDVAMGSDGVLHRHTLLDGLKTIYTPDLDRELVILPTIEDKLNVKWKESYRECSVSYYDHQRDRTWSTHLPDCLEEFLQAAVVESDPYTLEWQVDLHRRPTTVEHSRVSDLIASPFRYQTVSVPRHPLLRPHIGVSTSVQRTLSVARNRHMYQVEYERPDLKIFVRAKGARGRGDTTSAHALPLPSDATFLPDELELRAATVSEDPAVERYLRAFSSRVVYDSGACRHLFTTVILRPKESLDATLNAMGDALPKTKRDGGWLLLEVREPAEVQGVSINEWRSGGKGVPFASTITVSCRARCLKPILINYLMERWKELKPALTLVRLECSGSVFECVEAVLTANMADVPTFRCVVIQNSDEVALDAQIFRSLPFIDDVRPLQPEREATAERGVSADSRRKGVARDVYVAVDLLYKKGNLAKEVKGVLTERIKIHWTAFDHNYKLTEEENYIVVYDTGNRWTLGRVRDQLKRSPLAKAVLCLRTDRDKTPPSFSELEGRLRVHFFAESPATYLSRWLVAEAAAAPVSRLGPHTVSFEAYPDYGHFFDDVQRVNARARKIQVLSMAASTGGRYFFAVDSVAPHRCVFEHALVRDYLMSGLVLESASSHSADSARCRMLLEREPEKWGWRPIEKLLTKKSDSRVPSVRWYGACLDDMRRSSWREARCLSKLISRQLSVLDATFPGGVHSAASSTYFRRLDPLPEPADNTVKTYISVDYDGAVDAVIALRHYDPTEPDHSTLKISGASIEGAPVFISATEELIFHGLVRGFGMGCVSFVVEDVEEIERDEESADKLLDCILSALALFERTHKSKLLLVSVGGYVDPPLSVLPGDRDPRSDAVMLAFERAFEDQWGQGSCGMCRDMWRKSLLPGATLGEPDADLLRRHRDFKRQLLAIP